MEFQVCYWLLLCVIAFLFGMGLQESIDKRRFKRNENKSELPSMNKLYVRILYNSNRKPVGFHYMQDGDFYFRAKAYNSSNKEDAISKIKIELLNIVKQICEDIH